MRESLFPTVVGARRLALSVVAGLQLAVLPLSAATAQRADAQMTPERAKAVAERGKAAERTLRSKLDADITAARNTAAGTAADTPGSKAAAPAQAPSMEPQLRAALSRSTGSTRSTLRELTCGDRLCRVELGGATPADALAALSSATPCALPLIIPADGSGGSTLTAYVDCRQAAR